MILITLALVSVYPTRGLAADLTVMRTNTAILVDKQEIPFDAYATNGNNYFKLRDIVYILNGTESQFEVTWERP